jgi:hypothetical protein
MLLSDLASRRRRPDAFGFALSIVGRDAKVGDEVSVTVDSVAKRIHVPRRSRSW